MQTSKGISLLLNTVEKPVYFPYILPRSIVGNKGIINKTQISLLFELILNRHREGKESPFTHIQVCKSVSHPFLFTPSGLQFLNETCHQLNTASAMASRTDIIKSNYLFLHSTCKILHDIRFGFFFFFFNQNT